MTEQDKLFLEYEGNNWFKRNRESLEKVPEKDIALLLMNLFNVKHSKVLEVGASTGYRLAEIYKLFNADVYAVEPSKEAIEEGKKLFPFINFQRATALTMDYKKHFFDLVIVYSVFHWIGRENLLASISRIDNVLCWGGNIIIGDFQLNYPLKRNYHHIKEENVFTYKLDYRKIFLSTGFYKEVATLSKNHDSKFLTCDTTPDNYFSVSLLKKEDLYLEKNSSVS